MMNKKEITKFAKEIIHSQKGLRNQQLMHPKREWLTGIAVAVAIFVASITWSALQYAKYQTVEDGIVSPSAPVAPVYREEIVLDALSAYEAKASRLNRLLAGNEPTTLPDQPAEKEMETAEDTTQNQNDTQATTTQSTATSSDDQDTEKDEPTEKTLLQQLTPQVMSNQHHQKKALFNQPQIFNKAEIKSYQLGDLLFGQTH